MVKISTNFGSKVDPADLEELKSVYVLDYKDNYHRSADEPSCEFERRVRQLKRRYNNLNKFNQAINDYTDWMSYLAKKHGGHRLLKLKIKQGILKEYVPHKPKLKDNKTLKYLWENGIVLSEFDKKNPINMELADEFVKNNLMDTFDDDDDDYEWELSKEDKKEINDILRKMYEENGYDASKKNLPSDFDFVDAYFFDKNEIMCDKVTISTNGKKKKKKMSKKQKKAEKKKRKEQVKEYDFLAEPECRWRPSLNDLYNGNFDGFYRIDGDDYYDPGQLINYQGTFKTREDVEELAIYHKLNELGWNSYKIMRNRKAGKKFAEQFKEDKKKSKKKKKREKQTERFLMDIMGDNGYEDFQDFVKDMEDFTSTNIFM